MIFRNILGAADFIDITDGVAAGQGTNNLTYVNMTGNFDSVLFLVRIGTVVSTGTATLRARASTTTTFSSSGTVNCLVDPLTGALAQAFAGTGDTNTFLALNVFRPGPSAQYVRPEVVTATANVTILWGIAILYESKSNPFVPTQCASLNASGVGYYNVANPNLSAT